MNRKACLFGGGGIGLINGLLGGGGGMVAVPILRGIGLSERNAHATAIAVVLPVCAVSSIVYLCSGVVSLSFLIPVAIGVCMGGALGAKLLNAFPIRIISYLFEGLMLVAGIKLLFS